MSKKIRQLAFYIFNGIRHRLLLKLLVLSLEMRIIPPECLELPVDESIPMPLIMPAVFKVSLNAMIKV